MNRLRTAPPIAVLAVVAAALLVAGLVVADVTSARRAGAAGPNLVQNPSLETAVGTQPKCFSTYGWGTSTVAVTYLNGASLSHTGTRAMRVTVSGRTSGDYKVMQTQSVACAPTVAAGQTYTASVFYHSTSTALGLTLFAYTAAQGWQYWTDVPATFKAGTAWLLASGVTPAIPAGVTQVSFGVSLAGNGSLYTDDYSLTANSPPPPGCTGTVTQCAVGDWTVLSFPNHVRAIHTVVLNGGKILFMAGSGNDPTMTNFSSTLWDPTTNTWTDIPTPSDVFCSGHVQLPNGNVLIVGGNKAYPVPAGHGYEGLNSSYIFNITTLTYQRVNDLNTGHWYPSATELGNGNVFSMGGLDENSDGTVTNEMFNNATQQWLPTNQVPQQWNYFGLYPANILTATGKLFYSGSHVFGSQGNPTGPGAYLIDLSANTLTAVTGLQDPNERDQSAAVLLPPAQNQRVMVMGGGNVNTNVDANRLTDLIDLTASSPAYTPGPLLPQGMTEAGNTAAMQMTDSTVVPETGAQGKMYVSAVLLPDRTVFETGGALHNRADPVY